MRQLLLAVSHDRPPPLPALVCSWYNRVVSSAGSLSDITSKHVIPLQCE